MSRLNQKSPATNSSTGLVRQSVFNVMDYGAVADGSTDNTPAFTNCIAAAQAATGPKRVYVPSGTYAFNSVASGSILNLAADNLELFGDGMSRTILLLKASATVTGTMTFLTFTGIMQYIHDLSLQVSSGVTLSGGTANLVGIAFGSGSFHGKVSRVEVTGIIGNTTAGGSCINGFQPYNGVENTTTLGTAVITPGIITTVQPASMAGIYKGRILSIDTGGNQENVYVAATSATQFNAVYGLTHTSAATVTTNSEGQQYLEIENCYFHECPTCSAIILNSSGNVIRDNRIINVGQLSTQHGLYLQGGNNIVSGNYIEGVYGAAIHGHKAVPNIDGSGDIYENNTLIDCINYGIVLDTLSNTANPDVAMLVSTTLGTIVNPAATAWVTPASMAGIYPGQSLVIGGNTETVTVLATNATQFYATFTLTHVAADTVSSLATITASATLTRYGIIRGNVMRNHPDVATVINGILITGLPSCVISGNVFEDLAVGTWIDASTCTNLVVEGNIFRPLNHGSIGGVALRPGANALVRGNQFIGVSGQAIVASTGSIIDGNYVQNISTLSSTKSISLGAGNLNICNNRFEMTSIGAIFDGGAGGGHLIHDNIFNSTGGGFIAQWGTTLVSLKFYNNTLTGCYIRFDSANVNIEFYNNDGGLSLSGFPQYTMSRGAGKMIYVPKAAVTFANPGYLLKWSTGVTSPTAAPTTAAGTAGGAIDVGTHQWAYSNVNGNGETLVGPNSGTVTIAGGSQTEGLTAVAVGPTGTTSRKVYRSKAGTTTPLFLAGTIADNTTTTFSDAGSDASLGAQAPTTNTTMKVIGLATTDTSFIGVTTSQTGATAGDYYMAGQVGTEFQGMQTDGVWTAGNVGIPSTTVAAKIHDIGTAVPPASGTSYVIFQDSGTAAGTARVMIMRMG